MNIQTMIYQSPFFWGALITLGLVIGYFIRQLIAVRQLNSIEQRIKRQIEEAKSKAKEIILEAQEKATTLLEEVKKEERESKIQLGRLEERLLKRGADGRAVAGFKAAGRPNYPGC